MGKIAFVFSGQGAQAPGMGKSLCEVSPAAAKVFAFLDTIRPGTSEQCFSGTEEALKETINTQPCMFAVELAAAAALKERGIIPHMAAGFSLGEIAALTYTEATDLETGFRLVCRRGELMQAAAERHPAAMAAVVRLPADTVEQICASFAEVYPVNYNCPGQIAVAGAEAEMPAFCAAVKASGGRALPLKVRGGFHSPFMRGAAELFEKELESVSFSSPKMALYSNCTGLPYEGSGEEPLPKKLLAKQICSPVRWETIVRHMIACGVTTFVEIGPGNTLCGLIAKTDDTVRTFAVSDAETLENVCAALCV